MHEGTTREQLLEEINALRRRIAALEEAQSERRRIEEALRESERRYRELADSLPETVFEMDATGRITFANRSALERFGSTSEDFERGLYALDMLIPEDRDRARDNIAQVLFSTGSYTREPTEYTAMRKDGSTFPVVVCSNPVMRDGKPVGLRGFLVDITARKQAEIALRESEAMFRAIFDGAAIGIVVSNLRGDCLQSNPAIQKMLGYTEEEMWGKNSADATHPDDFQTTLELVEDLFAGRRDHYHSEKRLIRKDGTLAHTRVTVSIVRGVEGEPQFIMSMIEDMTERRQLQEQLLRAQRLETAGRIASQVAHDFNNLLGPMTAYPDLIREQLPEDHPALVFCDAMLDAAECMAEITENLMTLGRRGLLDEQPVDLNRLVLQAVNHMAPAPDTLAVDLRLHPNLPQLTGSPGQLLRMISNLLSNAREAMEDRGQISVTTEPNSGQLQGNRGPVDGSEYVRLQVIDTGLGIPPEAREKIFDPFFTTKTKANRRGSGLGLTIVQTIVDDHRGQLEVESEVGQGTTFRIFLPISTDAPQAKIVEKIPMGSEKVLVVDDDEPHRVVTRKSLERFGYQVETAASGEEAVDYLREHQVDLLVLDMVMPPGIDGAETYHRAVQLRPDQRAILLSGFAESERVREAQAMGAGAYLRKPVKLEKLARAIRQELDRQSRHPEALAESAAGLASSHPDPKRQ